MLAFALLSTALVGQTIVLYSNDFETPNTPLVVSCGNSLDPRGINLLYGTPGFSFQQTFTVEGVSVHDPSGLYQDPAAVGGNYALGMLSTVQPDLLALTLDAAGLGFVNVGFDLSSIDISGCGGPFGTAVPVMELSLYDTPSGQFDFGTPGTLLARGTVTGTLASSAFTFAWHYVTIGLDASGATAGPVTIVFDLTQSGYAAFDNLSIVASSTVGIVDRDTDGVADDQDNCPDAANQDQIDQDADGAGDACDPAPLDPMVCGDRDGDGADDCAAPDAGVAADAAVDAGTSTAADAAGVGDAQADAGAIDAAADAAPVDAARADGAAASDAARADGAAPVDAAGPSDAGVAGPGRDASTVDAGADPGGDGCGCATTRADPPSLPVLVLGACVAFAARRRGCFRR